MALNRIERLIRSASRRWKRKGPLPSGRRDNTSATIFARIYREKHWGGPSRDFYSGSGSYTPAVIEPFVLAVSTFLSQLPKPPVVVDIGCGDFTAAGRIAHLAQHYHGCDVVPELVDRNRRLFASSSITFHWVDATVDGLPDGDIVILKQVLQHLSNDHIGAVLAQLSRYPIWIVSEHVPPGLFTANRDIETGGYTRLALNSGVALTEPPFGIRPRTIELLCEVIEEGNPIRTTAYRF